MTLNQAQEQAVKHFLGPCMVLAGPGSGKTTTIAGRVKYLIENYKVRPEEILVITFTRGASYEMHERFKKLMGGKEFPVTFGTFHGVYFGILKWAYGLTSENILTEDEKYSIIRQILDSPELDFTLEIQDEKEYIKDLITEIGKVKNNDCNFKEYESEIATEYFGQIFQMYERQRKQLRKIDFDDMLVLCKDLFERRPDVLQKWQQKFRFILVDEFQDVNPIQYAVLQHLALPENNLFVVGDDDQSIYEFRGASPDIMLGFRKDYPDGRQILLNVNYRSSKNIVQSASRVIGHNQNRFEKEIISKEKNGECVHVQETSSPYDEANYVLNEIRKEMKKGVLPEKIAVLYRTGSDARVLAEQLMEYQIPFQMKEHVHNIYDHFIARNIKSYLSLVIGKRDRKYFLDIANCPKRYISREALSKAQISFEDMRRFYCDKDWMLDRIDQFQWDIEMMDGATPYAAIRYIRKRMEYDAYLKEYGRARKIQEEELFDILNEIEEKAKEFETIEEWFSYVEKYSVALKQQTEKQVKEKRGISLMTIHGSKGLEYDIVFLIHSNEGMIPYKKAKLEREIEEERRMFYVGMTRAKNRLVISYMKTKNGKDLNPSRFVHELFLNI